MSKNIGDNYSTFSRSGKREEIEVKKKKME